MHKLIYAAVAAIGVVLFAREYKREKDGSNERENGSSGGGSVGPNHRGGVPVHGSGSPADGKDGQLNKQSATPVDFPAQVNALQTNANPQDNGSDVPAANKA